MKIQIATCDTRHNEGHHADGYVIDRDHLAVIRDVLMEGLTQRIQHNQRYIRQAQQYDETADLSDVAAEIEEDQETLEVADELMSYLAMDGV